MGYHYPAEDTEQFENLHPKLQESVEKTLDSVGVDEYQNPIYLGTGDHDFEARVRVSIPPVLQTEIDLQESRSIRSLGESKEVLHLCAMLHEGRVEKVSTEGTVTLTVRARY